MRKQASEHRVAAARSCQAVANSFLPACERPLGKHSAVTREAKPKSRVLDSAFARLITKQFFQHTELLLRQGPEPDSNFWPLWLRHLTRPQYHAGGLRGER